MPTKAWMVFWCCLSSINPSRRPTASYRISIILISDAYAEHYVYIYMYIYWIYIYICICIRYDSNLEKSCHTWRRGEKSSFRGCERVSEPCCGRKGPHLLDFLCPALRASPLLQHARVPVLDIYFYSIRTFGCSTHCMDNFPYPTLNPDHSRSAEIQPLHIFVYLCVAASHFKDINMAGGWQRSGCRLARGMDMWVTWWFWLQGLAYRYAHKPCHSSKESCSFDNPWNSESVSATSSCNFQVPWPRAALHTIVLSFVTLSWFWRLLFVHPRDHPFRRCDQMWSALPHKASLKNFGQTKREQLCLFKDDVFCYFFQDLMTQSSSSPAALSWVFSNWVRTKEVYNLARTQGILEMWSWLPGSFSCKRSPAVSPAWS